MRRAHQPTIDQLAYQLLHLSVLQSTAKKLGYTKRLWNGDKEPEISDEYWDDLTGEQRQAAEVLGYNKDCWDKEEGMLAKCCVIL